MKIKNEKDVFNKFVESRKKLESMKNLRSLEWHTKLSGNFNINYIMTILKIIYSPYSVINNNLKNINFAFVDYSVSNSNSTIVSEDFRSYEIQYKDQIILYNAERLIYEFPSYSYIFKISHLQDKINLTKFHFYMRDSESKGIDFDISLEINEAIDVLPKVLEKSEYFYASLAKLRHGENVSEFIEKYKDSKELIVMLFLGMPNEVKERIFEEMKKQGSDIVKDDIDRIIRILKNSSHQDALFVEDKKTNNYLPPRGVMYANDIEKAWNKNKKGFDFIKKIFEYNELASKIEVKDTNYKIIKNKI